jgi:hypothetical protein
MYYHFSVEIFIFYLYKRIGGKIPADSPSAAHKEEKPKAEEPKAQAKEEPTAHAEPKEASESEESEEEKESDIG